MNQKARLNGINRIAPFTKIKRFSSKIQSEADFKHIKRIQEKYNPINKNIKENKNLKKSIQK